jgi:hypothetical protein
MTKWLSILVGISLLIGSSIFWPTSFFKPKVDYNTEVKPILNKHCIGCHGGVKKAGNVSFLFEHELFEPGKSGKIPIVKGNAAESEMIRRILSEDPDEKMPKDGVPLTEDEITTLKDWINQGAKWDIHWSYQPLKKPEVPRLRTLKNVFGLLPSTFNSWNEDPIDQFVLHSLHSKGLQPNQEADKATLLRRVSLDLTGIPPTEEEVNNFIADNTPTAYEKVVDRLLASPAYGERWAAMWLDLARYADSKGYESDGGRNIWRFRDYVIRSFNKDKPFDQFTIEQLAGDLLPPTNDGLPKEEELVATAFHRNTMVNHEGGTIDEEFRVAAQIDRVNTTWEVWQGTTFACIQCHSHPYDPIPHEDYYRFMAYFNNTRDEDTPSETPVLRYYKGDDSLKVAQLREWIQKHDASKQDEFMRFVHIMEPRMNSHDFTQGDNSTLLNVSYYAGKQKAWAEIPALTLDGNDYLIANINTRAPQATATFTVDSLKGPILAQVSIQPRDSVYIVPLQFSQGKRKLFVSFHSPKQPEDWIRINWLTLQPALPGHQDEQYKSILEMYASLLTRSQDGVPILWEGNGDYARKTHLFERGNWLVKGTEVTPGIPALLTPTNAPSPTDRLQMARWLISRENPLTARVIVNRFWEQIFGRGIVETLEDFGSQGIEPTHPELLDWLAVTFIEEDQWRVKSLLKRIVLSSTYRQSSVTNREKTEKDPDNRWLSRGPRVRLSAEQVRDQALAVSQLLSTKMYGPSVMPPQPDKIWQSPYSGERWVLSEGENKHRRAIYTYWKRTSPYPSMVTFDAPSREFCQSRRILTNTPLQALVTLNDPVYLEAAHQLALRMQQKGSSAKQQLDAGYRLLTQQSLAPEKLSILENVYQDALQTYLQDPMQADTLLMYGAQKSPELAALMVAANVILNLDNVVTKQ